MLFYVKGGPKEGQTPPPPEKLLENVIREWEVIIDLQKQGKIQAAYGFVEQKGGFIIYDVESREELDELLTKLPLLKMAKKFF